MQRIVEFIFGKPDKSNIFARIGYWIFAAMYAAVLILAILQSAHWMAILAGALIFPVFFRIVNKVNSLILQKINMKVFFIAASIFTFILLIGAAAVIYFFADNVTVNADKQISNGTVTVSIGTLRGNYDVTEIGTYDGGSVNVYIPYTASVGDGTITLSAETEDRVLWEQEISDSRNGTMHIQGFTTDGSFDVQVAAEEANDISVEIRNPGN